MAEDNLLMFYGKECRHCHELMPVVEKVEEEQGVSVKKLEVWHNSENRKLFEGFDKGKCGGVPFLYNKKTGKSICGEGSYDDLKNWAQGK